MSSNTMLPAMISRYGTDTKKIYVMTHFVYPRELTDVAIKAVGLLQKAGPE
jgi:L-lysine 2,3-aminomutase